MNNNLEISDFFVQNILYNLNLSAEKALEGAMINHSCATIFLGLFIEQQHEIQYLKEKVLSLEDRLIMEISKAPPKFIPP